MDVQRRSDDDEDFNLNITNVDKSSFVGIWKLIVKQGINKPILFVIQNVKTFPSDQLNQIIHLIHKYRSLYKLKLNLMIGIQANSLDHLNNSLSMQSGLKIIIKKFFFPSMKKILLEIIYRMIKSKQACFDFGE